MAEFLDCSLEGAKKAQADREARCLVGYGKSVELWPTEPLDGCVVMAEQDQEQRLGSRRQQWPWPSEDVGERM